MCVKCRHWVAVVHLWLPRAIAIACWRRVERGKELTFIEANKVYCLHVGLSLDFLLYLVAKQTANQRAASAGPCLRGGLLLFTQPDWLPTLPTLSGNFSTLNSTEKG